MIEITTSAAVTILAVAVIVLGGIWLIAKWVECLPEVEQDPGPWIWQREWLSQRQCPYRSEATGRRCMYYSGTGHHHNSWTYT